MNQEKIDQVKRLFDKANMFQMQKREKFETKKKIEQENAGLKNQIYQEMKKAGKKKVTIRPKTISSINQIDNNNNNNNNNTQVENNSINENKKKEEKEEKLVARSIKKHALNKPTTTRMLLAVENILGKEKRDHVETILCEEREERAKKSQKTYKLIARNINQNSSNASKKSIKPVPKRVVIRKKIKTIKNPSTTTSTQSTTPSQPMLENFANPSTKTTPVKSTSLQSNKTNSPKTK